MGGNRQNKTERTSAAIDPALARHAIVDEMVGAAPVLLSAAVAGAVAIGATVAIERWGGKTGGLLSTLPTTVVPASLGIAQLSPNPDAFGAAMFVVPAGMLVNALFLWSWRWLPARLPQAGLGATLAMTLAGSLCIWAAAALGSSALLSALSGLGLPLGLLALSLTLSLGVVGALANRQSRPAPRGSRRVGPLTLLARGLLAAVAIGLSVLLAEVAGPMAAGLAATFPAIFLTTMVSLWLSQGTAVQAGAVGPMMLGSASVSAYAVLVALTLPAWGPLWGATSAWLGAVALVTLPAALWLARRPAPAV